ncbi:E3 ubiquitin-protein ligase TRIM39-like [Protopterus annectens]|uniref:E3 ubiquitin-protein ligase TRIM39-like n=1 Tax=Protopterus annectens TaxID=7888 RepID=UPI001CFA769C|nr:E3 ubiquitin-protein ligase TRIM39-like [Protopterus annectens]
MMQCDYCREDLKPAVNTCVQCKISLCGFHLEMHEAKFSQGAHDLISPTESLKEWICSEHGKLKEYYCKDDEIPICASCGILGSHKSHHIQDITAANHEKKSNLNTFKEEITQISEHFTLAVKDLKYQQSVLMEFKNKGKNQIKEICNRLHGLVQQKEETLFASFDFIQDNLSQMLLQNMRMLEGKQKSINAFITEAEKLQGQCNSLHFLKTLKSLYERFQTARESEKVRTTIKVLNEQEIEEIFQQAQRNLNETFEIIENHVKLCFNFTFSQIMEQEGSKHREERVASASYQNTFASESVQLPCIRGKISPLSNECLNSPLQSGYSDNKVPEISEDLLNNEPSPGDIDTLNTCLKSQHRLYQKVTLKPDNNETDHYKLEMSSDKRWTLCLKPGHDETKLYVPYVVCSPSFSSGKHCWEVEIHGEGKWIIGVSEVKDMDNNRSQYSWRIEWDGYKLSAWCSKTKIPMEKSISFNSTTISIFCNREKGYLAFYDSRKRSESEKLVTTEPISDYILHKFEIKGVKGAFFPFFSILDCNITLL